MTAALDMGTTTGGAPGSVGTGALELRVVRDIGEIDAAEWDSLLAPDDLLLTHRYLTVCQESGVENARYWYLMFYRAERLAATAVLSRMVVSLDLLSTGFTRKAILAIRKLLPGFMKIPTLFCGVPVSHGYPSIRFRDNVDPEPILERLAIEMEAIAAEQGIRLLCLKEFFPEDTNRADGLLHLGFFRGRSLPFSLMPVTWRNHEEYLGSLRSGYRRQVHWAENRLQSNGIRLEVLGDYRDHLDEIFTLYEQVMDNAPFQLERLNREYFRLLPELMPEETAAIIATGDRGLEAALIVLLSPARTTSHFAGIRYETQKETCAYVCLLQELIRLAIERRSEQIDFGQNSYYLKGRLGAGTEPLFIYLRYRNRVMHALLSLISPLLFPDTEVPSLRVFCAEPEDHHDD
ncbi:GNAT family N-acetyltransferase [Gemmatimonadota bacterium]